MAIERFLQDTYEKALPIPPLALMTYWGEMYKAYKEWSGSSNIDKIGKGDIYRMCTICGKDDTETLTIKQCMGCITYCYCSDTCQM